MSRIKGRIQKQPGNCGVGHFTVDLLCCLARTGGPATNEVILKRANPAFAFDLIRQIEGDQPRKIILVSPYSVSSVFLRDRR
jgi:hypothetical protein